MNENGMIFWEGKSAANNRPIVAIATGLERSSRNRKTDHMIQTWILDALVSPTETSAQQLDASVCWDCPARRSLGGACYVTLHQAPSAIWNCYDRGNYPRASPAELSHLLEGQMLRLGAYGDPIMVPRQVWGTLLRYVSGWTGYTHSWMKWKARPYRDILMASVESRRARWAARALGWRTFRVTKYEEREKGEVWCPASEHEGHRKSCAECGACDGVGRGAGASRASIVIPIHGPLSPRFWEPVGNYPVFAGGN